MDLLNWGSQAQMKKIYSHYFCRTDLNKSMLGNDIFRLQHLIVMTERVALINFAF